MGVKPREGEWGRIEVESRKLHELFDFTRVFSKCSSTLLYSTLLSSTLLH